jgi:copper homeostasis protein (lipoprotein)
MIRIIVILVFIVAAGCESSDRHDDGVVADAANKLTVDSAHNSRNSVDWPGVYTGVLPCADCAGIRTSLTLQQDGRFTRRATYLGKSAAPHTDEGSFAWDDDGRLVTLKSADGPEQMYQVGEDQLFHLDMEGNRITGDLAGSYVLEKLINDPRIEGKTWVLTELNGQPVQAPQGSEQPHFELQAAEAKVTGHASCNRFFGSYELKRGNRIAFGDNMGMTMMACPDMAIEMDFMEAMRRADNYAVSTDELSLNKARMAPLARFSAASQ